MALTMANWGGNGINMGWLDGQTGCKETCDDDTAAFTLSNINITTRKPKEDIMHPLTMQNLIFGDKCSTRYNDSCDGCDDCYWSWQSKDA